LHFSSFTFKTVSKRISTYNQYRISGTANFMFFIIFYYFKTLGEVLPALIAMMLFLPLKIAIKFLKLFTNGR
jgi:hypothetical protein